MRLLEVLLSCEGLAAPLASSPVNVWKDRGTPYAHYRNPPQEGQCGPRYRRIHFP
jgi:hypothetical protein